MSESDFPYLQMLELGRGCHLEKSKYQLSFYAYIPMLGPTDLFWLLEIFYCPRPKLYEK